MFPYPRYSPAQFIPHAILSHRDLQQYSHPSYPPEKKTPEMNPHPRLHPHLRRDSSDTYRTHSGFPQIPTRSICPPGNAQSGIGAIIQYRLIHIGPYESYGSGSIEALTA